MQTFLKLVAILPTQAKKFYCEKEQTEVCINASAQASSSFPMFFLLVSLRSSDTIHFPSLCSNICSIISLCTSRQIRNDILSK